MILVFGTICLDRLQSVPNLPAAGGYVEIESELQEAGGEATNTARALLRLGVPFRLAGNSIGVGPDAEMIESKLAEAGFRSWEIPAAEHSAPICDIYVTPDGVRTMFGRGFREMPFRSQPANVDWQGVEWVAVDSNHGATARRMAMLAHDRGVRAYLMDCNEDQEPLQPGDVWQSSTDALGGSGDATQCRTMVEQRARPSGAAAILTDGDRGLWFAEGDHAASYFPAFPAPRVVDSTGCGDAFRAGVLLGLSEGRSWTASLRFGAACGALNCRELGALAGQPTRAEVEELIQSHPGVAAAYE